VQDFARQVEALVSNDELRQTIIANAKDHVETNHSDKTEHQAYSKMASEMCKVSNRNREDVTVVEESTKEEVEERSTRVRFQIGKESKKKKVTLVKLDDDQDADSATPGSVASNETSAVTEEARGGENELAMDKKQNKVAEKDDTPQKENEDGKNASQSTSEDGVSVRGDVLPPDGEEKESKAECSRTAPGLAAVEEESEQGQTSASGETNAADKINSVEQPAAGNCSSTDNDGAANTSSRKSPRAAVGFKIDAGKQTTPAKSPETVRKGSAVAGESTQKRWAGSVSNGKKKTTTAARPSSKKMPLESTASADKALLKTPYGHRSVRRALSDTYCQPKQRAGEGVARPVASRPQQNTSSKK